MVMVRRMWGYEDGDGEEGVGRVQHLVQQIRSLVRVDVV